MLNNSDVHEIYNISINFPRKSKFKYLIDASDDGGGSCNVCELKTTNVLDATYTLPDNYHSINNSTLNKKVYVHPECWRAYCAARLAHTGHRRE